MLKSDHADFVRHLAIGRTLTANIKPLKRRRLLKVAVDKEDKRSRRLFITAAGRTLLQKAYPLWRPSHIDSEFLISHVGAKNFRQVLILLS